MQTYTAPIIAIHRSPLKQKFGTPRQPNLVALSSQIVMYPPFDTYDAFVGMANHSHLWVIWQFHHNRSQNNFRPQVRPPRLGGNDKMGVFATRSMYRPSGLGLSVVRLLDICHDHGRSVVLSISGADMIDGTPIIDIKPYLPYSDSVGDATSQIDTPSTKAVIISDTAKFALAQLIKQGQINDQDGDTICQLIAQDPRPAYRQTHAGEHFVMRYANTDVLFFMNAMGELVIDDVVLVV